MFAQQDPLILEKEDLVQALFDALPSDDKYAYPGPSDLNNIGSLSPLAADIGLEFLKETYGYNFDAFDLDDFSPEPGTSRIELKPIRSHRKKCNLCGKWFLSRRRLFAHKTLHYPNRRVCLFCGIVLKPDVDYSIHLERKHHRPRYGWDESNEEVKSNEKLTCFECGYEANSVKQLWRHGTRTKHATRPTKLRIAEWFCTECPYRTRVKMNWQRHLWRKHKIGKPSNAPKLATTDERMCSTCAKSFANLSSLTRHFR
ncbi:unnamed protein product, partial [Mesorhabditis belari]|uniref:C2H2-type domain-containing protein n=1 Tax=Mesorhabditis belari TaxID=2138241 RepID=A0AAF3FDD4_9BILA